jgi:ABC-type transport system substrate-binding protein
VWVTAGPLFEKQLAIMTDTWQKAGVDAQPWVIPVAQTRDNSTRMQFPGLLSHGVNTEERDAMVNVTTPEVGTAANRWSGSNRGGYSNPEYDRLFEQYSTTLDRSQRVQRIVEMTKFRSDELPAIMLFFNYSPVAHTAALRGPTTDAPNTTPYWNIQDWELS